MKIEHTQEWTEQYKKFYNLGYKEGYLAGAKALEKIYKTALRRLKKYLDLKFKD